MPEKEVTPSTVKELTPPEVNKPAARSASKPITKNTTPKPTQKVEYVNKPIKKLKPKYRYAGEESLVKIIGKSIPKQLIPTNRFATILGLIFLAIIMLPLVQFPFDKLLSGDTNITIGIGYPQTFLKLQIQDPEEPPLRIMNLIIDLIIFFILSYAIDVLINFITDSKLLKNKEERMKHPKTYRRLQPTLADKVTRKVFKKQA